MASDTTNFINIPITPGGMLGDIVEDELGSHQHQRIENLRQIKKGEWELAPGYRNTLTGFTNKKAGIEVDEDASGDRFRLIQDGINILRVDHNISNSPLFGYENEPTVALSLPSGVTIAVTDTLRFFHFRGVIRISGASEPLHYSYIDRTVFDGDDSFSIIGWKLESSILQWSSNDVSIVSATEILSEEVTNWSIFFKFFFVFDESQFSLQRDCTIFSGANKSYGEEIEVRITEPTVSIQVRIPGTSLKNNLFNDRITGIGLALAAKGTDVIPIESYNGDKEPTFVPEIILISDELPKVSFNSQSSLWRSSSNTNLRLKDSDTSLPFSAGYMGVSVKVKLTYFTKSIDTSVVSIDFNNTAEPGITPAILIVFADDLTSLLMPDGTIASVTNPVGLTITREWIYDSTNGYHTFIALNAEVLGTFYEDFVGIPIGTLQNTPNWEAIQFLSERSYISGQTGDIGSEIVSGGTIETVTVVEDNFIDTNGILLTAHTMDVGNGWVSVDGVAIKWEIQSNEAHDSNANLGTTVYTESNRSDKIKITGRMVLNGVNDVVRILFRLVDSSNWWELVYTGSSLPTVSIRRNVASLATLRTGEAHTISDGVSVTFEIELDGDVITCKILTPETHTLTTTDNTHLSATKHGFQSLNSNIGLVIVDAFKITEDILTPTSTAVANDAFTNTNGVALTAHTMPLGNGWTSAGAQWEIQSNEARDSGSGSGVQVITELNKSDKLIITGKIMINDPLDETRISFRHHTIANEWYFAYSGSNDPKFDIRRVIATVHTTQQTQVHTVADGTFVSFQITLDGSSIELKILSPEVYTLQVTDSTHLTETKITFFPLATNAGVTRIDDLVVVETVESFIIDSQEEDTVRYSAIGQFDNHPIGNVIQTEVGTTDKILNLAKRDNQLTILKARSISTGGFVGAFYSENIGFTKHGLFSVLGVLSVTISLNAEESNEFILIMDQDDLYLYNGNQIVSFFEKVELRQFYRDNVTTTSFMLFDKLNGEILFFLGTEILVWNMHIPEFYIRSTDITPLYGFLDADNRLIIGDATKQVTFNHSLSPYDENHGYLIRTKVFDNRTPHRYKRLKQIQSYLGTTETQLITITETQVPETVFSDEFLNSGPGTLLTTTPEIDLIGRGWFYQDSTAGATGSDLISPSEARSATSFANDRNIGLVETGLKDFTITHVFRRNSPATVGIDTVFRRKVDKTFWYVRYLPTPNTITLFKVNAAEPALAVQVAQVVEPTLPGAASATYVVECIGSSIKIKVNGTLHIDVIDSFNSDATHHGLGLQGTGGHDRHESFKVESAFGEVIEETLGVAPTILKHRRNFTKHLFKEMTIEFKNSATSNVITAQIRDYLLKVERWQKP